jgi:predicted NBD/HSP70 family sugar kinase
LEKITLNFKPEILYTLEYSLRGKMMKFTIGVDIGGTFTDTVVMSNTGEISVFKVSSTPQDNSKWVIASIELASQAFGLRVNEFLAKNVDIAGVPFFGKKIMESKAKSLEKEFTQNLQEKLNSWRSGKGGEK